MKKIIPAVLALIMLIGVAGCGSKVPANKVNSLNDLPGKTIGVQESTTGDIYATDEYEKQGSKIDRYSKGNDAVLALIQGKVDCVIIDEEPAKSFVNANKGKLKILSEPFVEEQYAICVAKNNAILTAEINSALKKLKENGTLKNIVDGYINGGSYKYKSPDNVSRTKGELVMATNAYFPPYEYYKDNKVVGIDPDIALAICDILGYSLKIEDTEFGSIIAGVQSGKYSFGMAGMTVTEDRLKSIDFTESYAASKQVIIVRSK